MFRPSDDALDILRGAHELPPGQRGDDKLALQTLLEFRKAYEPQFRPILPKKANGKYPSTFKHFQRGFRDHINGGLTVPPGHDVLYSHIQARWLERWKTGRILGAAPSLDVH